MRIVFDSNVLMAAFGTRGLCDALFAACGGEHRRYVSEPIFAEVTRHLSGKFKMPLERVEQIETYLREQCASVVPVDVPADACRDPGQQFTIRVARSGRGCGDALARSGHCGAKSGG